MKFFHHKQMTSWLVCFMFVFSVGYAINAWAVSDSAKVISATGQNNANRSEGKFAVVALVNMDEVLPDCQQHVGKVTILDVHYSASGISIESIRFNWSGARLDVATHIGEEAIFTIDDIRNATRFIQMGKSYLIHFQQCWEGSRRRLINLYALPA